eukprot:1670119-Pyramimonas_sp.AAC.1
MSDADLCMIRLHVLGRHVPGYVATSLCKSLFNAWDTTRRWRCGAGGCHFGYNAIGGNDILHHMVCPIAWNVLTNALGRPQENRDGNPL